jgi:hypothetical protein
MSRFASFCFKRNCNRHAIMTAIIVVKQKDINYNRIWSVIQIFVEKIIAGTIA